MMNRSWVFPCRVDPRFQHLQDKEIVLGYHLLIDNLTMKNPAAKPQGILTQGVVFIIFAR